MPSVSFRAVGRKQVSSHFWMLSSEDAGCAHFLALPCGRPLAPMTWVLSGGSRATKRRGSGAAGPRPARAAGDERSSPFPTSGRGQRGWAQGQGRVAAAGFKATTTDKEIQSWPGQERGCRRESSAGERGVVGRAEGGREGGRHLSGFDHAEVTIWAALQTLG